LPHFVVHEPHGLFGVVGEFNIGLFVLGNKNVLIKDDVWSSE